MLGYGAEGKIIKEFQSNIDDDVFRLQMRKGIFPQIQRPIKFHTENGKFWILYKDSVKYEQYKITKEYVRSSASVHITKDFKISNGRVKPKEVETTEVLAKGCLFLTNKRLAFVGDNKDLIIGLNDIDSIEHDSNSITISRSGVAKKTVF